MNDRIGLEGGKHFAKLVAVANIGGEILELPLCLDFVQIGALQFRRIVIIQVIDDGEAFAFPQEALRHVRSDEPRSTCDEDIIHGLLSTGNALLYSFLRAA